MDQFGYGDPVYDLATLLHSVGGMATILQSIEDGTSDQLLSIYEGEDGIQIRFSRPFAHLVDSVVVEFPELCGEIQPPETMGPHFRQRLFVGAANATIGWLKYKNAVKTAKAWWAIFALSALFLHLATRKDCSHA